VELHTAKIFFGKQFVSLFFSFKQVKKGQSIAVLTTMLLHSLKNKWKMPFVFAKSQFFTLI